MAPRFTLDDIDRAHDGVTKNGVRQYLGRLRDLGVKQCTTWIADGHTDFCDEAGDTVSSHPVHDPYPVAEDADPKAARAAIEAHGRGETDYFEMSRALADAGVAAWEMDTGQLTLTYRATSGAPVMKDRL